jgi:hypothetical protein
MGMDIYSNSGVVLPVADAAAAIFRKADKEQVLRAVEEVKAKWDMTDKSGLDGINDAHSLVAWVAEVAERLVNKEGEYIDSLALVNLFEILCESLEIELPLFEFDYWTRSRISGWEVPTNTPCIVFSSDGLFETKMSKEGKRLAAILGTKKIESSTWTIMSV